jgi:hypothetical protein
MHGRIAVITPEGVALVIRLLLLCALNGAQIIITAV